MVGKKVPDDFSEEMVECANCGETSGLMFDIYIGIFPKGEIQRLLEKKLDVLPEAKYDERIFMKGWEEIYSHIGKGSLAFCSLKCATEYLKNLLEKEQK